MRKLFLAALFCTALAGCATGPQAEFPIATGPLKAGELTEGYAPVAFASRVFDVVNQDMTAETKTGIAGKVEPMPVDILSGYAAKKFKAVGGIYSTRFVIRQAEFSVRAVEAPAETGWFAGWFSKSSEAELTANVTAMLAASKADGSSATITATVTQSEKLGFDSTPEARRKAYMELMDKVLASLDGEFTKQLPVYFDDVMAK